MANLLAPFGGATAPGEMAPMPGGSPSAGPPPPPAPMPPARGKGGKKGGGKGKGFPQKGMR